MHSRPDAKTEILEDTRVPDVRIEGVLEIRYYYNPLPQFA
jgi:hypothetical protein